MINKEIIIEILKMYSSDVDNFNKAVFEDEFNTVAGLIQQLLNKHDVMRWVEFKKQMPPLCTVVATLYKDGSIGAGQYATTDDVKKVMKKFNPKSWLVIPPPIV